MSSVLSSLLAITTQCRKLEETGTLSKQAVFKLFKPLLSVVVEKRVYSEEELLMTVFSEYLRFTCSEIELEDEVRLAMESQSMKDYSAGQLDVVPDAVMSHTLSYLDIPDRISVECVCKYLFTLSRRTPIVCEQFEYLPKRKYPKWQHLQPKTIEVTGVPEVMDSDFSNVDLSSVQSLIIRCKESNLDWVSSHEFPNLRTLKIETRSIWNAIEADWIGWELIDRNQITNLTLKSVETRRTFGESSISIFFRLLSQRQSVKDLKIEYFRTNASASEFGTLDMSHLRSLSIIGCDFKPGTLGQLIDPGLKEFHFALNPRSDRFWSIYYDWSFLQIANLEKLTLDVPNMSMDSLMETVNSGIPRMKEFKELNFNSSRLSLSQFKRLIRVCSDSKITTMRIKLDRLLADKSWNWEDGLLTGFPEQSKVEIKVHGFDGDADEFILGIVLEGWKCGHSVTFELRNAVESSNPRILSTDGFHPSQIIQWRKSD